MILILGGTTEGRCLARYLRSSGFKVTLSTATAFPNPRDTNAVPTRTGPLSRHELAGLITGRRIQAVIDATHPFARQISHLARSACNQTRLPYLRFERGGAVIPSHRNIAVVSS